MSYREYEDCTLDASTMPVGMEAATSSNLAESSVMRACCRFYVSIHNKFFYLTLNISV
jgi:hypothetical protein